LSRISAPSRSFSYSEGRNIRTVPLMMGCGMLVVNNTSRSIIGLSTCAWSLQHGRSVEPTSCNTKHGGRSALCSQHLGETTTWSS